MSLEGATTGSNENRTDRVNGAGGTACYILQNMFNRIIFCKSYDTDAKGGM